MTGGKTDISVIEIKSPGEDRKEEIHIVERTCGVAVSVNKNIIQWLDNIFGKDIMKQLEQEHRSDYMSLITNFEEKTRLLDFKGDKHVCFLIPQFLKCCIEKGSGFSLEEHFAKLNISGVQVKKTWKTISSLISFVKNVFSAKS